MSKDYYRCLAQIENLVNGSSDYNSETVIENVRMSFFTGTITELERDSLLNKLEEEINEKES